MSTVATKFHSFQRRKKNDKFCFLFHLVFFSLFTTITTFSQQEIFNQKEANSLNP